MPRAADRTDMAGTDMARTDMARTDMARTDMARSDMARAILDVAACQLRHRGYEATTVRLIAAAVGIKAASIYHHFRSKDAVVAAVVNEGVRVVHEAVVTALDALPETAGSQARVETAVRAHLLASLQNSDYTSASIRAFAFLPDGIRRTCGVQRRAYEDVWRGIVDEAAASGAIRAGVSRDSVRLLLLGAVNWAGEWYRPAHLSPTHLSIDTLAHDFAAALLDR